MNDDQIQYQMYINGGWAKARDSQTFATFNPFTGKPWAQIPEATEVDVDAAVIAARGAYETVWRGTSGLERARLMNRLADLLDADADRLARIETTDNGKVIRETKNQMHFSARNYRFFAGAADRINGSVIPLDNPSIFDYTMRESRGVAALLTAWNSPIQILANKLPAALAAGNTVVVKPSEHTSASTLEFAGLMESAGFPPGVFNVVTGGAKVGAWLTSHPDVNIISLTGGPETGRQIAKNAAANLTPLILELGGKSANIIFADADLDRAIPGAVAGIFAATGQTCIAGSRLLVQRSIYDVVVERLAQRAAQVQLGDPMEEKTEMGPVAHRAQFDSILAYIKKAVEEGASLVAGGTVVDSEGGGGLFVAPTVFSDVTPRMTVAREEIFGPVLSVLPFESDDEAIEIANGTRFGLASGVWTQDLRRAHLMAKEMRSGVVWINTYRTSAAQAPFGGVKQSGFGRERGLEAMLEYTQVKNVMIDLSNEDRDPFSMKVQ